MPKALHSEPNKLFRTLLSEARLNAKLTQSEVAKRLEKPQSYVAKYENGERRLDVIEFLEVSQAVGFDAGAILKKLRKSL